LETSRRRIDITLKKKNNNIQIHTPVFTRFLFCFVKYKTSENMNEYESVIIRNFMSKTKKKNEMKKRKREREKEKLFWFFVFLLSIDEYIENC